MDILWFELRHAPEHGRALCSAKRCWPIWFAEANVGNAPLKRDEVLNNYPTRPEDMVIEI
jgi:hypothetical protein